MTNDFQSDNQQENNLHNLLLKHFSAEDLRTICFELGIDFDDLPGQSRPSKARELVLFLARRERTLELIGVCKRIRPNATWNFELLEESIEDLISISTESQSTREEIAPRQSLGFLWGITLILIFVIVGSLFFLANFNNKSNCFRQIFPDAPYNSRTSTYGANGKAVINTICISILDGKKNYFEVNLQSYREGREGESGAILILGKYDIEQSQILSITIRGEHGGELIGIKLKNVDGIEETIWLADDMINFQPTTQWSEAMIPLSKFLGVIGRPIESITFFSDGNAGLEPQIFYISNINFE